MRFLVVKKMGGEGCDYTIGCGMRFDWIEADSIDQAEEKAVWPDGRDEWPAVDRDSEMALSEILIVPEDAVRTVDVGKWADDVASLQASVMRLRQFRKKKSVQS